MYLIIFLVVVLIVFTFTKKPVKFSNHSYLALGFYLGIIVLVLLNITAAIQYSYQSKQPGADNSFGIAGIIIGDIVYGVPLLLIFLGIGKYKDHKEKNRLSQQAPVPKKQI